MFSCESCEISKITFFYRTPPVATSEPLAMFTAGNKAQRFSSVNHTQKQPTEIYMKKGVLLKKFSKFNGKQLCQSLFLNKVAGLRPAIWFKKGLWHSCIPVNFTKFSRKSFSQNTSRQLLLHTTKTIQHHHYHQLFSQKAHLGCLSGFWIRLWYFNWVKETKKPLKPFPTLKCMNVLMFPFVRSSHRRCTFKKGVL